MKGVPHPWAFPVLLTGLVLSLVAKISVLRKGVLLSFRESILRNTSRVMGVCYALSWIPMIAARILSFRPVDP